MLHHLVGVCLRGASERGIPLQRSQAMLCAVFVCRLHQLTSFIRLRMRAAGHSDKTSEREDAGAGLRNHFADRSCFIRTRVTIYFRYHKRCRCFRFAAQRQQCPQCAGIDDVEVSIFFR